MKTDSYTVKYKLVGDFFWKKLKDVVADDTMFRANTGGDRKQFPLQDTLPTRVLFLRDGTRVELPIGACIIEFSSERAEVIEAAMKAGK